MKIYIQLHVSAMLGQSQAVYNRIKKRHERTYVILFKIEFNFNNITYIVAPCLVT